MLIKLYKMEKVSITKDELRAKISDLISKLDKLLTELKAIPNYRYNLSRLYNDLYSSLIKKKEKALIIIEEKFLMILVII